MILSKVFLKGGKFVRIGEPVYFKKGDSKRLIRASLRLRGSRFHLAADAPNMIGIALVVTEEVGSVKHKNPGACGIILEGS